MTTFVLAAPQILVVDDNSEKLRSTAIYAHVQAAPSKKSANRVAGKIAAALAGKVIAFR
jgi:hypothetical protein